MYDLLRYLGQAAFYALTAIMIGYFASRPVYVQIPDGHAQIKLSFSHGAARTEACRKLTSEEIAKLPANERRPSTCARERTSIHTQLLVDDQVVYDEVLEPTGLSRDGPARTYQKFVVPAARYKIEVRMRDSTRTEGFDYRNSVVVDLKPLQNLAIDFRADAGGFTFR